MRRARLQILVAFFLTVSIVVTYKVLSSSFIDADLRKARIAYETEKIQLEREQLKRYDALDQERLQIKRAGLQRYDDLNFYGIIGFLSICGISLVIFTIGYTRARVRSASVYTAKIGQHSEIPIHQRDLQNFYPIAVNLSLAEIEASTSQSHEKAYHISRRMIADITEYTRALAGKRGLVTSGSTPLAQYPGEIPVMTSSPTFAELLHNKTIAPGKPLVFGVDRQGQPQTRNLQDIKSLAVAGLQGSGKTLSMGFLVASSILAYGVRTYVIDPHKHHPESLSSLLRPLEHTGHITVINPFDTPALLKQLNATLDRRLSGAESGSPGILLVIDEMARLAKMECFDVLVTFLERCTEETRKANITFIGGSHKWTARHFKGRADIRACMNSMLIHKTKPSQADLLLEDAHDKHLVKHIHQPGEAILVTDYDAPVLVSVPMCTRRDMETVAAMLATRQTSGSESDIQRESGSSATHQQEGEQKPEAAAPQHTFEAETPEMQASNTISEVIPLDRHRKPSQYTTRDGCEADLITAEMLHARLQQRKTQDPTLTQTEIARQAGISQGYLSRILSGQTSLTDKLRQILYGILFENKQRKEAGRSSFQFWKLRKTAGR